MTKDTKIDLLNKFLDEVNIDRSQISDGYHTFSELYSHRNTLFIALSKMLQKSGAYFVWRSLKQSDGIQYKNWFLMGISEEPGKQISYHLPYELWEKTNFATTLPKAPEFDGHKSEDVTNRLFEL